jgi:putative transcriptional regulator
MIAGKSKFLIAMPSLIEPVFSHSVVLVAEQAEDGDMGFIINLSTGTSLLKTLKMFNLSLQNVPDIPILFGGPVQRDFFWFLHSTDFQSESTLKIQQTFYISPAVELIPLLKNRNSLQVYYSGVGYVGWGPGQLEKEIEEGSWWLGEFDVDLLLGTPHDQQWNKAFTLMGVDPDTLVDKSTPFNTVIN